MTTVRLRRRSRSPSIYSTTAARVCLLLAVTWPALFYVLFPSSGRGPEDVRPRTVRSRVAQLGSDVRGGLIAAGGAARHLASRYELSGYGPRHPRVGVIVVAQCHDDSGGGDAKDGGSDVKGHVLASAESVFALTDRNRLLVLTVVLDGCVESAVAGLEEALLELDSGARGSHLHGAASHTHTHDGNGGGGGGGGGGSNNGNRHDRKLHVIANPPPARGLAAARAEGAAFVRILADKHADAGLKDPDEDILLLLLRAGATLRRPEPALDAHAHKSKDDTWLDIVTPALVPPPGMMSPLASDANVGAGADAVIAAAAPTHPERHAGDTVPHATKLANAVSLACDSIGTPMDPNHLARASPGATLTVDAGFGTILPSRASVADPAVGESGEVSYPTPLLNSWAFAMRLGTFVSLPASDTALVSPAAADLQLSLNLWLCADGIDVLPRARAAAPAAAVNEPSDRDLPPRDTARLAAAWTTEGDRRYVFRANGRADVEELARMAARAADDDSAPLPSNLAKKCRDFRFFADLAGWERRDREDGGGGDADRGNDGAAAAGANAAAGAPARDERPPRAALDAGNDENALHPNIKAHDHPPHREPSKPLSQTNLLIVQKAGQVDSEFVPVPNGERVDHPHKGARDERGKWGYVHDASVWRRPSVAPFRIEGDEKRKACGTHDQDWKMITKKVVVDHAAHEAAERAHHQRVKVMCIVYTIEKYHDKVPAIRDTWGQKCDGFMVASTKTDRELGTVDLPHEGKEEYHNIWQKVRAIWSYVYDHYYDQFDYFHIGGDDMYVLVENLRLYLESEDVQTAQNGGIYLPSGGPAEGDGGKQTPLFLGRRMAQEGNMEEIFNSGGSGYTLNRAALKVLVKKSMPKCMPHMHTFSEDVLVSRCLRKVNVVPYDTKDDAMGERYMPFNPGHHFRYRPPADITEDWYSHYSIDVKWGLDHCAARSVSFHYIEPEKMRRIHALLYGHCS